MIPLARLTHQTDGRARVQVPALRREHAYFETVADALSQCPGVERLEANPLTGSILVFHRGRFDDVRDYAERKELFRIGKSRKSARLQGHRFSDDFFEMTARWDHNIATFTNGDMDLNSVIILALLGAAAWQAKRGKLLPAGTALVSQAISLMNMSRQRRYITDPM